MRPLLCLALCVLAACNTEKPPEAAVATPPASGSPVERYFPLEEGKIYNYVTNEGGDTGMLVTRVHRADPTHGELRMSNASKRFVYLPDGVAYEGGAYILKAPLEVGASWPGEHGGSTRIVSKDAAPKLTANAYSGCIQTVEEGGRPQGARYTTTYCPDVGMVLLEVSAQGAEARAELKSYGFPVK